DMKNCEYASQRRSFTLGEQNGLERQHRLPFGQQCVPILTEKSLAIPCGTNRKQSSAVTARKRIVTQQYAFLHLFLSCRELKAPTRSTTFTFLSGGVPLWREMGKSRSMPL